jgi:hypothetical protein
VVRRVASVRSTLPLFVSKLSVHVQRVFKPFANIVRWVFLLSFYECRKLELFKIEMERDGGPVYVLWFPSKKAIAAVFNRKETYPKNMSGFKECYL